jgi:hypothetical protein
MGQTTSELVTKYSVKAAGYYREIIDATVEPQTTLSNNVVVVGQFAQGPVMRPVLCKTPSIAHAIFGQRNSKLEAKGNYGMLMAEHMLEQGQIYILNLKNIDQFNETLQVKHLAVNDEEQDALVDEKIATVYDTNKFWKVDPMYGVYGSGPVLSFASILQGDVTVVIEKYWSKNYNYTVGKTKEYNAAFTGEGLNDDDFVNDYLIRVHVFKCNLSKAKLSVANAFVNGRLNLKAIDAIKNDVNSKYFATYTGTVGNVIDLDGNNLNIAITMNADENASGVHVAFNNDAIATNGIDLLGKSALQFSETGDAMPTVKEVSRLGYKFTPELKLICVYNSDTEDNVGYMFDDCPVAVGQVVANENKSVRVLSKAYIDDIYSLPSTVVIGSKQAPVMPDGKPFPVNASRAPVYPSTSIKAGQAVEFDETNKAVWYYEDFVPVQAKWSISAKIAAVGAKTLKLTFSINGNDNVYTETAASGSASDMQTGLTAILAKLKTDTGIEATATATGEDTIAIELATTTLPKGLSIATLSKFSIDDTDVAINKVDETSTIASYALSTMHASITVDADHVTFNSQTNDIDKDAVAEVYGTKKTVCKVTFSESLKSSLTSVTNAPVLTNGGTYGTSQFVSINGQHIAITPRVYAMMSNWYETAATSGVNNIQGIVDLEKHYVNGTAARQNAVLDRLTDTGIMVSFADPTIFRCRYMIDTFKTYIEPNAKHQFATLADEAKRFPVITAMPFYHELRTSKNPDFHDTLGQFQMSYVAAGSNPDKPSTNSFSWPQNDTAKWLIPVMNVMYDNGFGAKVVPATGAVGKLYYSKLTGTRKVYDIVAGADFAISASGVIGPEFNPAQPDRAAMEQLGANVIMTINGVLQLYSDKTAYQVVKSAFNYPETIEKCLFVSDQVEPVLAGKVFKYNNADARLAVKQYADSICDGMVSDGVIADYENKCDLDNNPVAVRKAGIIVLDTVLYNEYGIRIAVHRTTIKDPEA